MIVRRPQADADVVEQALYIARDNPEAGGRLFAAVDATLTLLERMPRIGRRVAFRSRHARGLRRHAVTGFPNQVLFYLVTRDGIELVRVLHAARDLPRAMREP